MVLILMALAATGWLLYQGIQFYKRMNWEEPPEPSPDLKALRQRQAELFHIQDVLAGAQQEGKLSQNLVDEFNRYCESEIQILDSVRKKWENRRSQN